MQGLNYFQLFKNSILNYDIDVRKEIFIGHNENLTYKIIDTSGDQYLLRIHIPTNIGQIGLQHTFEGLNSEMNILNLLSKSNFTCPKPIKNKFGNYVSQTLDFENKKFYYNTLFKWIEGETYQKIKKGKGKITYQFGQVVAKLHLKMEDIGTKQPFNRLEYSIDKYYTFLDKLLYGVNKGVITERQYGKFNEVINMVNAILINNRRTKETWGLIHGDLQGSNVIIKNTGDVSLIDFCSTGYGYYLLDIADALATMEVEFREIFIRGYSNVRKIHEAEYHLISGLIIMTYIAAYSFHILNEDLHEWIKESATHMSSEIYNLFVGGESIISKILK